MKKVLVIDDDPFAGEFFKSLFGAQEYEPTVVSDPKMGIRLFRDRLFDLVVLNVLLPRMGGLIALQEIDPRHTHVPVIAIADGDAAAASAPFRLALTLGAVRCFPKSFEFPAFLEAVEDLTRSRGATARVSI